MSLIIVHFSQSFINFNAKRGIPIISNNTVLNITLFFDNLFEYYWKKSTPLIKLLNME